MMMTNRHLVQTLKVAKLTMSTIKMENQTAILVKNTFQVDELEKLFDGCAYIEPHPPPGLLLNQKLHWLDHVRTDGDCDYAEKAEVLAQLFSKKVPCFANYNISQSCFKKYSEQKRARNNKIHVYDFDGKVKKWLTFEAPLLDSSTLPKCLRFTKK